MSAPSPQLWLLLLEYIFKWQYRIRNGAGAGAKNKGDKWSRSRVRNTVDLDPAHIE